ncbi:MAG: enoyl-CoA hydratase/isomerase family protein [Thermoanaerobaculales bacterium]
MIDVTKRGRIVHLSINAPPVNVLDSAVLSDLVAHLRRLAADENVAAVLLSGAGRCFSAGASVAEHKQERADAMLSSLLDACRALAELPVPAVALVHGACLGGALELISFCDFAVADPAATFGQPEIRLAFFPPVACYQLPRLTGLQNAAYTIFTGDTLSAERALAMGIVQRVVPKEEWGQVEAQLDGLSMPALRVTKEALVLGAGAHRVEALERLKRLFLDRLYRLEDVREGIAAFEEKRKPEWKHR